jgi:hypothetical protein
LEQTTKRQHSSLSLFFCHISQPVLFSCSFLLYLALCPVYFTSLTLLLVFLYSVLVFIQQIIRKMSIRQRAKDTDFSDILPEEMEGPLKEAAEVSMGTEIAEEDVENIRALAEQVIAISDYRASLYEYLRNRMNAIAPNLTVMVGELVGARLIAHAGSLLSLAKHPASTVQILGAEKALFRALKTKHDTPKYGLIYHASLVGQAAPKLKGKVSRTLAAKTALSIRVDALGEMEGVTVGFEGKEKVELRLKQLETGQNIKHTSSAAKQKPAQDKYSKPATPASVLTYISHARWHSSSSSATTHAPFLPPATDDQSLLTVFKVFRTHNVENEVYLQRPLFPFSILSPSRGAPACDRWLTLPVSSFFCAFHSLLFSKTYNADGDSSMRDVSADADGAADGELSKEAKKAKKQAKKEAERAAAEAAASKAEAAVGSKRPRDDSANGEDEDDEAARKAAKKAKKSEKKAAEESAAVSESAKSEKKKKKSKESSE